MIILFTPICFWINSILLGALFYVNSILSSEAPPEPEIAIFGFILSLLALLLAYILKALKKPRFKILATIALPAAYGWAEGWEQALALLFLLTVAWLYLAEFAFIARRLKTGNEPPADPQA